MPEKLQVYACSDCGMTIEVLHGGECQLMCGDHPMKLLEENTVDAAKEKHVPMVEKIDGGFKVAVGSVTHPMEEKHYIEWIQIIDPKTGRTERKFLTPGEAPEATFQFDAERVIAREFCNIHGLWKGE